MSRADCIRLALLSALIACAVVSFPVGGQERVSPLAPINEAREREDLPPMEESASLDELATQYLTGMIASRCLCPLADGAAGSKRLAGNVRLAIGGNASVVDAGLMVGYDQSAERAIRTVALDPANASAILGQRLRLVGVATAVVDVGASWLAPPPGKVGPNIDLDGYTIVVLVTAGETE